LEQIFKVRVCMHPDRSVAVTKLKQVLTFYMVSDPNEWQAGHDTGYGALFERMGYADELADVRRAFTTEGFRAAQIAIPDVMLSGDTNREPVPMVAASSIQEVRDRLYPYMEAGGTRIIIPYVPVTEDSVGEATAFLNAWRD
jgi:hypothetical protein